MKRILISLLLVITLLTSVLSFVGCGIIETNTPDTNQGDSQNDTPNVGDEEQPDDENGEQPDDGKEETPEKPEHVHEYVYEIVPMAGGYALEGTCSVEGCDNPTDIFAISPAYEYIEPATCKQMAESRWTYTHEGIDYVRSIFFPGVNGDHSYEDGKCIYCQAEEPEEPVVPEHTHTWSEATCTTPATCTECGETLGSEKGHAWKEATCTSPVTCTVCGETSGEASGHSWISATCTVAMTCSVCGGTKGEPNGHSWTEATCTVAMTCTVCHITSGSANGHTFDGPRCLVCGITNPDYITPSTHAHIDIDNNGSCDSCYESVIVIIDFYVVNDLHGKFCDTDTQPGVDNLATYLKSRDDYDDNVIIFSSGDMWQGAAESNLTNGLILTEWMNELDFVSMTLGNHEYDWGEDAIRQNLAVAEFPFLAINIYDKTTGKLADYCTPSIIVECDGLQIGIIGAIGDCYSSISSDQVQNVEFKVGSELTALVKAESDRLRAQGVDLIIYSLHDGYGSSNSSAGSISSSNLSSYYDTALSNGYVDVVFEGHTHQKYVYYDNYGVYHVQGGGENKGITHVEFSINSANGNKSLTEAEVVASSVYSSYAEDPGTEAIEDKYADVIDMAYTVIGTVSKKQSSSTVADIVSELYLTAGLEKWGDKYDIVLGGGFIQTRSPYDLAAGNVTYSDVLSLLPFDNQLVLCSIKGTYLKSKFINTTNSSYHNTYSTYGQSIKNNINNNTTYYVVVDTYTAFYAPNNLTIVDYYDDGVYARDLLANEIKNGRFDNGSGSGNGSTGTITLTSIPDILSIGKALTTGTTTSEEYYVKGTITSITQTTYGNMYIKDENGNELLIYGLYDQSGNRYGNMSSKPQVGDTIIVLGPILKYNASTIEIKNGTLISVE